MLRVLDHWESQKPIRYSAANIDCPQTVTGYINRCANNG